MVTKADVQRVLAKVNRATDLAYFFDTLTSPEWLEALQESGLFATAPSEEVEGDFVRYPAWAASRYLARMAPLAPGRVFSMIQQLPESNNPRIHEDITRAASAMPSALSRQLVPQIRHWVDTDRHLLLLPERVVELTIHLANVGVSEEALELARSLLAISVEDDLTGVEIRARLSDHDYVESLEQLAGPLVATAATPTLQLFVDLLDQALYERYPQGAGRDGRFEDGSTIWRRDIADREDGESRFQPVLNSLVDAVLSAARACAINEDGDPFEILRYARAAVFRRIELQLLTELPSAPARTVVVRLLVNRAQLSDHTSELEYLRALRANTVQLTPAQGRQIARWISLGPLRSKFLSKRFGHEWDSYLTTWQARRLAALGQATPTANREWASNLLAQVDEEDLLPVRPATVATWIGPTSPRNTDDLAVMPVDELVSYLKEWTPTGEWASPSPDGLGRALAEAIAQHPFRFSQSAAAFIGLEPVYVRSLFSGFRDPLGNGRRPQVRHQQHGRRVHHVLCPG